MTKAAQIKTQVMSFVSIACRHFGPSLLCVPAGTAEVSSVSSIVTIIGEGMRVGQRDLP